MAEMNEYLWIVIVGCLFGFLYAFGIGANDVANAFATSVSSKSLTLKQAVVVASIFEFCGAMFLGASVTSTVRGKIFDSEIYEDEPEIVLLGMFTSLITASFMLLGATHYGLPVSTTHTVIGCVIGFTVAAKGFGSLNWKTCGNIFISWVAAPVITGIFAFLIFFFIKKAILTSSDPFSRGYYLFSFILFFTIGIDIFFIFHKGTKNFKHFYTEIYDLKWVIPTSFGIGAFCGLLWIWPIGPQVKKGMEAKRADREKIAAAASNHLTDLDSNSVGANNSDVEEAAKIPEADDKQQKDIEKKKFSFFKKFKNATYGQDLGEQSFAENAKTKELWENFTQYDEDVEHLFTYVQVFTACLNSFAHGANDIANAIAPVAAIVSIYETGALNSKAPVQKWVLGYGSVGLVLGLLLYGYKVMKTIGYKLTALSPSRGSSAELAASLMVVTASYMGIPVSTTQCVVGAVAGIGLVGGYKNVQWLSLGKVCIGWVGIFFAACVLSAGLFSFVAYSPSLMI